MTLHSRISKYKWIASGYQTMANGDIMLCLFASSCSIQFTLSPSSSTSSLVITARYFAVVVFLQVEAQATAPF